MIKGRKEMTTSDNDVAKLSGSKSSDKKRGFLRRISKKASSPRAVPLAVVLREVTIRMLFMAVISKTRL